MCNPNLLHSNSDGYITRCSGCGQVQIAFGTCLVVLNEQEFDVFVEMITERMEANQEAAATCPHKKQFRFYTDSRQVQLIFSFSDLEKMYHLLLPAQLMLQVSQL